MKKLFLTIVVILCVVMNVLSQSFIGENKTTIKNDVIKEYGNGVVGMTDKDDILSISFNDNHSALYFFNSNDLCLYYVLCHPISNYYTIRDYINNSYTKVTGYEKWYYKDGEYFMYYKILVDPEGKIFWVMVYPDFFENDINELIKLL